MNLWSAPMKLSIYCLARFPTLVLVSMVKPIKATGFLATKPICPTGLIPPLLITRTIEHRYRQPRKIQSVFLKTLVVNLWSRRSLLLVIRILEKSVFRTWAVGTINLKRMGLNSTRKHAVWMWLLLILLQSLTKLVRPLWAKPLIYGSMSPKPIPNSLETNNGAGLWTLYSLSSNEKYWTGTMPPLISRRDWIMSILMRADLYKQEKKLETICLQLRQLSAFAQQHKPYFG